MSRCFTDRFLLGVLVLAAVAVAVPAQAASCPGCSAQQKECATGCLVQDTKDALVSCLMVCDNAAAACSCDEPVTLRSEDVVRQGLAELRPELFGFKAAACHSTTPCGSAYPSCASWSSYADCGDPWCGVYKFCGDPPFCEEPELCFGPATRTFQERFRVCFNAGGQPCTEYQRISVVQGCGC